MVDVLGLELTEQFMISFLFILAIVFGGLEISNIFKKNRVISALIAVAVALFASTNQPFTLLLWSYLPTITWAFVALFFIAFGLEVMGLRKRNVNPIESMIVAGAVLTILIGVGWKFIGNIGFEIPFIGGAENIMFGAGLIFIMVLFWGVLKVGPGEQPQK